MSKGRERGKENKLKINENREENMICCTNSLWAFQKPSSTCWCCCCAAVSSSSSRHHHNTHLALIAFGLHSHSQSQCTYPALGGNVMRKRKRRTEQKLYFHLDLMRFKTTWLLFLRFLLVSPSLRPLRQNLPLTVSVLRNLTLTYLTRCVLAVHAFHIHIYSSEVFNMCVWALVLSCALA